MPYDMEHINPENGWGRAWSEELLWGGDSFAGMQGVESRYMEYSFQDLFDMEEVQRMQDAFAQAMGVASIITAPDGTPITKPSNFCSLCNGLLGDPECGTARCNSAKALLGTYNPDGPTTLVCVPGGLLSCGASISVADNHLGTWLAGQVLCRELEPEEIRARAVECRVDPAVYAEALGEVPRMPRERFDMVGQSLFLVAGQLSRAAYQGAMLKEYMAKKQYAELKIRKMKRVIHDTLNRMPSVVVALDRRGRILLWNDAADGLAADGGGDMLGRPFTDVLPAPWVDDPGMLEAFAGAKSYLRHGVKWHDGESERFCDVMMYPLDPGGEGGAVIRVDDVSERVRVEQVMLQTEKMMSVGGLAAGMAHEINNPLGGVLQGVQNVLRRVDPQFPRNRAMAGECGLSLEAMRDYLERRGVISMLEGIRGSGERAAGIIQDMLGYSRNSDSSVKWCDLNQLIDKILNLCACDYDMKKNYDFKNIKITRYYDPGCVDVPCIATELEQVIFNLVRNAAYSMAEAGRDEPPRIVVRTGIEGNEAVIEIRDNGKGFDPETGKRLFEPFFTTKPPGEGTGLGLSVSYFVITEKHGGSLAAESEPGRGATFTIRLPLERRP